MHEPQFSCESAERVETGHPKREIGGATHAVIGLITAAVVLVAVLNPASALAVETRSRVVVSDPTGDGWFSENDGPSSVPARPTPKTIDVRRLVVHHRHRAVTIKVAVVNLRRAGTQEVNLDVRTTRDRYDQYSIEGQSTRSNRQGRVRIEDPDGTVVCPKASTMWAYNRDFLKVRLPRREGCIGGPDWVRVGGFTSVWFDDSGATYVDNGMSAREASDAQTPRAYKPSL